MLVMQAIAVFAVFKLYQNSFVGDRMPPTPRRGWVGVER